MIAGSDKPRARSSSRRASRSKSLCFVKTVGCVVLPDEPLLRRALERKRAHGDRSSHGAWGTGPGDLLGPRAMPLCERAAVRGGSEPAAAMGPPPPRGRCGVPPLVGPWLQAATPTPASRNLEKEAFPCGKRPVRSPQRWRRQISPGGTCATPRESSLELDLDSARTRPHWRRRISHGGSCATPRGAALELDLDSAWTREGCSTRARRCDMGGLRRGCPGRGAKSRIESAVTCETQPGAWTWVSDQPPGRHGMAPRCS
jgi:hypothetical protein